MPENPYAEIYAGFQKNTENHQLTIEHDIDGYRTLHVGEPGTGIWHWKVITSPFYLTIVGDIADGYTFTRTFDMLDFFGRGSRPSHYDDGSPAINPHYWAEKLTRDGRESVKEYSKETAISVLKDLLDESETLGLDELKAYEDARKVIDRYIAEQNIDLDEYLRRQALHQVPQLDFGPDYFGNYELPVVSIPDQRAEVIDQIEERAELGEHALRNWLSREPQTDIFGQDAFWEHDFSEYTHDFILACYAIVKTVSLYRAQAPASDGFIVVEGGLVQNSPALPVFDLDVLDSDQSVDDVFEELFGLYERIHNHGDSRRPVDDGLMAYVPEIEEKLKLATGDNAHHLPQMLADVQEKYQRRLELARRIE